MKTSIQNVVLFVFLLLITSEGQSQQLASEYAEVMHNFSEGEAKSSFITNRLSSVYGAIPNSTTHRNRNCFGDTQLAWRLARRSDKVLPALSDFSPYGSFQGPAGPAKLPSQSSELFPLSDSAKRYFATGAMLKLRQRQDNKQIKSLGFSLTLALRSFSFYKPLIERFAKVFLSNKASDAIVQHSDALSVAYHLGQAHKGPNGVGLLTTSLHTANSAEILGFFRMSMYILTEPGNFEDGYVFPIFSCYHTVFKELHK